MYLPRFIVTAWKRSDECLGCQNSSYSFLQLLRIKIESVLLIKIAPVFLHRRPQWPQKKGGLGGAGLFPLYLKILMVFALLLSMRAIASLQSVSMLGIHTAIEYTNYCSLLPGILPKYTSAVLMEKQSAAYFDQRYCLSSAPSPYF